MKGVGRYLTKREVVKMFSNLILRHVWIQHFLSILTASGSLLAVLNSVVSLSLEKHQQGFFIILVTFRIWTYFAKETALYWNSLAQLASDMPATMAFRSLGSHGTERGTCVNVSVWGCRKQLVPHHLQPLYFAVFLT